MLVVLRLMSTMHQQAAATAAWHHRHRFKWSPLPLNQIIMHAYTCRTKIHVRGPTYRLHESIMQDRGEVSGQTEISLLLTIIIGL